MQFQKGSLKLHVIARKDQSKANARADAKPGYYYRP